MNQCSAELFFDLLSESTDDYIFMWDMVQNVFRISDKIFDEYHLDRRVVNDLATYWPLIIKEEDREVWSRNIQEVLDGKTDYHNLEYRLINKENKNIWVSCRGKTETSEDGNSILMIGRISDIGKQNKFDNATGIRNREQFEVEAKRMIRDENFTTGCMIVMDVDNFKNINERYGHSFGDTVLKRLATEIEQHLPKGCNLFRLDGDEFAFFLENQRLSYIQQIFENIKLSINLNFKVEETQLYCSLSAGACLYPQDGETYQDLSKHTESALEIAKINGKNQITFFSDDIHQRKIHIIEVQENLRNCVDHGFQEFEVFYQPQVDVLTRNVIGAEALLRWHSPTYGEVSPIEFIPLLEESNLIVEVGKWVFEEAAKQCKEWQKIEQDFTMSINVSYIQLKESTLKQYLKEGIEKLQLSPKSCVLELTENCWIPDLNMVNDGFKEIQDMGYDIAIDDFGTGYSSLNFLKELPVNIIKIDRSFIQGIAKDTYEYTFLECIIKLAHIIHLKVCVEGVETWEEFHVVKLAKPDFIQGYLFGKPMPAECFYTTYLKTNETAANL